MDGVQFSRPWFEQQDPPQKGLPFGCLVLLAGRWWTSGAPCPQFVRWFPISIHCHLVQRRRPAFSGQSNRWEVGGWVGRPDLTLAICQVRSCFFKVSNGEPFISRSAFGQVRCPRTPQPPLCKDSSNNSICRKGMEAS